MPPHKKLIKPGDVEHHGRVTARRDDIPFPRDAAPSALNTPKRRTNARETPAPSSRYTPPVKSVRFRSGWHKVVGAVFLVIGLAIVILNDIVLLGASATLLPGGHSEFYLMLGVIIAGYSTWWFGWFDREK